jgi:hypothetical protein
VFRLLKPLVRLLLRNNVPYAAFADIAKRAYVEIADKDFRMPNRKQSDSRIATITGLTRKEVARLKKLDYQGQQPDVAKYHRAARVVYGWVQDRKYAKANGESMDLPFDSKDGPCFCKLVKQYSGDMPARAILDELIRVGVVKQVDDRYHLLQRAFIPSTSEIEKLGILGLDVSGLIQTIEHNLYETGEDKFFQRKIYYDNLPAEALPEIQQLLEEQGQAFLEVADRFMSQHDRDVNPKVKGEGQHAAGIGLYYFENREDGEQK